MVPIGQGGQSPGRFLLLLKAKFHYAILLANQLASWFASWSATC